MSNVIEYTFPELIWTRNRAGISDHQRRQMNEPATLTDMHLVLGAETKADAQALCLALLSKLEAHRQIFRELGYCPPHMRDTEELLATGRYWLAVEKGLRPPQKHGPNVIPFERV